MTNTHIIWAAQNQKHSDDCRRNRLGNKYPIQLQEIIANVIRYFLGNNSENYYQWGNITVDLNGTK